jgi:hypothetical protein
MNPQLLKLLMRAGVFMAPADGEGNDLGGGADDSELTEEQKTEAAAKAQKEADDKAAADKLKGEQENADADKNKPGKPSDAEAKLLKEVMALKTKAAAAADELKAYKDAAGESKPDELKALIEAKKEADRLALEKRGEYDRILEQVKGEHTKEVTTLNDRIAALELQLSEKDNSLVELTVGRAFSDSPFIREKSLIPASLARKEFGAHVDIVDGAAVVYDKPRGASDRTPLVDGAGKPKSFEEGIQALYSTHPEAAALIRAAGKPGSGSNTTDLGGKKPDDQKEISAGAGRIAAGLAARAAAAKK